VEIGNHSPKVDREFVSQSDEGFGPVCGERADKKWKAQLGRQGVLGSKMLVKLFFEVYKVCLGVTREAQGKSAVGG